MAIWQYDVVAIPRKAIIAAFGGLPKEIQPELLDTHSWWSGNSGPDEAELSCLLISSSSWSKSIKTWGASDGNRIELHYNEGHLFEVRIRIDLRKPFQPFLEGILELAIIHDYVFVTENTCLLEPTIDAFRADMAKSQAFSFVRNPSEFFKQLSRGTKRGNP